MQGAELKGRTRKELLGGRDHLPPRDTRLAVADCLDRWVQTPCRRLEVRSKDDCRAGGRGPQPAARPAPDGAKAAPAHRSSQYRATDCSDLLKEGKIVCSMFTKGCCWGNAVVESMTMETP